MVTKGVSYFGLVQKRIDRLNRVLQENLQAIRLVKAYLRGTYEASRFDKVASRLKIDTVKALRTMEYIMPVLLFIMNMSLLAVLWFGTKQIASGTTPLGDIVAIVNYTMRMTGSFSMFAFIIIFLCSCQGSTERMAEVLSTENDTEQSSSVESPSSGRYFGELAFENVSFKYPGGDSPVLANVSFHVKSGEKLAIMGATGAGKSTLLQLIPRFYDVTEGRILVEGKDIQQWDLQELREIIGYVPQQSLLFTGNIADNVRWGDADAEMAAVRQATMQAQIHASVEDFPQGYETRVGQKGVNLSGGQKQRLSIARALLRKGHLLMLDDSTSALDVKTEQALWEALSEEPATMLVVTQKIRTAKGADRILLIDAGEVVACGTHNELLRTSELYKKNRSLPTGGGKIMAFFQKPFGYEPILTTEDVQQVVKKKKGPRATDWRSTLLRLWKIVDEQRVLLIIVLLLVMVSSILALLGPYIIGKMIDMYVTHGELAGLGKGIILLIGIYALLAVALFLQNYWMIGIAQQTIYRLRTSVFAHFQRLPISFFDRRQHGELMSRMTNDIEAVNSTLNSSFIQVFSSVLTLTGTVIIMLSLSPLLTVLTMTIIPIMFWAMRWITRRTAPLFKQQQVAIGALNGMIEETISGQRIVKAFSQEDRMLKEFREKSLRLKTTGFWAQTYSGYIPKVMNFLNNMSFTIVAGIGGVLALYGHVSIGVIVIFTEYARQFTRPLNDLANQFNTVLSAIAGAERVFALLDEKPEVETASAQKHKLLGQVSFQHVYFKYELEEEAYTLKDVNFKVEPGQTVALVGATGAGKTTILQLIARFYEVTKGEVLFDGVNVQQIERQALRSQMAFVLQDPFLFEASVRENIRYGRLDASDEEIVEAAKRANAHDFIIKLKKWL